MSQRKQPRVVKTCLDCGVEYTTSANSAPRSFRCRKCQRRRKYELEKALRQEKQRRKPTFRGAPATWQIVKDPTPFEEGGFRRGAEFPGEQFRLMLSAGCLATGTVVLNRITNRKYEIRGKHYVRVTA